MPTLPGAWEYLERGIAAFGAAATLLTFLTPAAPATASSGSAAVAALRSSTAETRATGCRLEGHWGIVVEIKILLNEKIKIIGKLFLTSL